MVPKHLTTNDLRGKTIDCHSHAGVGLKYYSSLEYPYGQTVDAIYYKQRSSGVDVNVVFPSSASLFFDSSYFAKGEMRPAKNPISRAPYAIENEMLMLEVFKFNAAHKHHFIPFVSVDPGRMVPEQIEILHELEQQFPIYGIKISPVECQSKTTELLYEGSAFLDFAADRDIPLLLHTTVDPEEEYSHASMAFEVIEQNPGLRFCLAHCIGFHAEFLDRAGELPNVWVDTAALKIQVQCVQENLRIVAVEGDRFTADYADHRKVMLSLMAKYPDSILWGTDSPWYTFFCRRKQGDNSYLDFHLDGSYEDEICALDALPEGLRLKACNTNTLAFLFG